jgi:ribose transport system permease protein
MNLASVGSCLKMMVLRTLLIVAVIADQVRDRLIASG